MLVSCLPPSSYYCGLHTPQYNCFCILPPGLQRCLSNVSAKEMSLPKKNCPPIQKGAQDYKLQTMEGPLPVDVHPLCIQKNFID